MSFEFLILNGYGVFVWSAFIFTFICFFALYLKTSKELKKQEKAFISEFKQWPTAKIIVVKDKGTSKEVLSARASI